MSESNNDDVGDNDDDDDDYDEDDVEGIKSEKLHKPPVNLEVSSVWNFLSRFKIIFSFKHNIVFNLY